MREIIEQAEAWTKAGESVAVATVIETWGSAPRTIGAKMVMTPSHHIAGSVSGGCVEGAVFEAGVQTLETNKPQLLHFGVADETAFESVGLACGGIIEIFVEPLTQSLCDFWWHAFANDMHVVTATIVRGPEDLVGYKLMLDGDGVVYTSIQDERFNMITPQLLTVAHIALWEGMSKRITLPSRAASAGSEGARGEALSTNEKWGIEKKEVGMTIEIEAFVDVTLPKPTLVIVGAVHIAIALTTIAQALGYRVIIVDPREAFGNRERFPHADQIISEFPNKAFESIAITRSTAVVTLTHDMKFDDPALQVALVSPAFYVGALGGAKTRVTRHERLLKAGITAAQMNRLHTPIGIDISTRSPEEIALATMAQIVAIRNG